MKYYLALLIILLWADTSFAQDYQMKINNMDKTGFSYENYPFPEGMKVYDLEKNKIILKPVGLTLVQIWSLSSGAEPQVWFRVREIEKQYKDLGLHTYSINFENGYNFKGQHQAMKDFFTKVEKPEHFYFDGQGYTIDFLRVKGFPTYYLVDEKGNVVFRTNGKSEEGVALLEEEIRSRLASTSNR